MSSRLGHRTPPTPPPSRLLLTDASGALAGWLSLGERTESEIALGAVGRFWQPDIEWYDVSEMTPPQFAAFDEPGWGRIAAAFSLRHYGTSRTLISYEARTATGDPRVARRFAHYWTVARPFARHIMRATLDDAAARRRGALRMAGGAAVFMIAGTLQNPHTSPTGPVRPGSMDSGRAPGAAATLQS